MKSMIIKKNSKICTLHWKNWKIKKWRKI